MQPQKLCGIMGRILIITAVIFLLTDATEVQVLSVSLDELHGQRPSVSAGMSSLPPEARSNFSAALGHDARFYHARVLGAAAEVDNAKHGLSARFTSQGVEMRRGSGRWKLAVRGYGYGENLHQASKAAPTVNFNRVEYRRGPLTEWYVNGPLGLEQGFTLVERPGRGVDQPLAILLAIEGNLTTKVDHGGKGLTLISRAGRAQLRYGDIFAYDAAGRELPAWLEVSGGQLMLKAEDTKARYPVTIDPFVQAAELTASDGKAGQELGLAVAISGNTVVAGCYGKAYVFIEPPTGWVNATQTAELVASDGVSGDGFGFAVSVSGGTIVVGAHASNSGRGAAYVYVEPPTGWPSKVGQTAKLTASDGLWEQVGRSVSISGNTIVAGAPGASINGQNQQGSAYVFVEPATGWANMTETAKLTASDGVALDSLGYSVGIDGATVTAGAPAMGNSTSMGAVYVFAEPAAGWVSMTQTAKLTASDGVAGDRLGNFVAISGNTVVAGAPEAAVGHNRQQGAAYVFVEPPSGWVDMTQNAKLTSSDGVAYGFFGRAVAISGSIVVVGAPAQTVGSYTQQGAVYEFAEPPTGWGDLTETAELDAQNGRKNDNVGGRVGIDGDNIVAGAAGWPGSAGSKQGAAFVFTGP